MNVLLAVLDVDGTLLDPKGNLRPRVRNAVLGATARGCLVTLASGRRLWAVRPIVEALGIDTPVILYNGAIVYDVGLKKPLFTCNLEPDPFVAALDVIWTAGFQPVVYESPRQGERVFSGPPERDNAAVRHYLARPTVQPTRIARELLPQIAEPLLLAAMGEGYQMRALEARAEEIAIECSTLVEQQSFVAGSRWWQLDITAPSCSKGHALERLCALTGVSPAQTLAVGDGINDLELISRAGIGVAMGNAVPELKKAAAATVADNAHDGAAEALERFVLGWRS